MNLIIKIPETEKQPTVPFSVLIDHILGRGVRREMAEEVGAVAYDTAHLFREYVLKGQTEERHVTDVPALERALNALEFEHPHQLSRPWLVDVGSHNRISGHPLTLQAGIDLLRSALRALPAGEPRR